MKRVIFFGLSFLGAVFIIFGQACSDVEFQSVNKALNDPNGGFCTNCDPGNEDPPPSDPICVAEEFVQKTTTVTDKVDLLFVVDTSGSLDQERQKLADSIDLFIDSINDGVDINIAALLAHGPNSSHYGILRESSNSGPAVLKTKELTRNKLKDYLSAKLSGVNDSSTDGGEAGLLALNAAITEKFETAQAKGFFREDAALVVVFLSDENDICFNTQPNRVKDAEKINGQEVELWAAQQFCGNLTYQSVYSALTNAKGSMPTLVSGIIYLDPYPAGGENETGWGYLNLIALAGGVPVNLDGGTQAIANGLKFIADMTNTRITYQSIFPMEYIPYKPSEISVSINGAPVQFNYLESINSVQLIGNFGLENDLITLNYCY